MPIGVTDPTAPDPAYPTVQDVADVIPRRALQGSGLAVGTFTDDTSPTAAQVRRLADKFGASTAAALGGEVPGALAARARSVAALGAAAQLELSFFPEAADSVSKPLFDRYDKDLQVLIAEAERLEQTDLPGGDDGSGVGYAGAVGSFPDVVCGDLEQLLTTRPLYPLGLLPDEWPRWYG